MRDLQSLEFHVPEIAKEKIRQTNRQILETYRVFRDLNDPAAHLLFGMTAEEFAVARHLNHSEILQLSNVGLPLWAKRVNFKLVNPDATGVLAVVDRENVVRSLLESFSGTGLDLPR